MDLRPFLKTLKKELIHASEYLHVHVSGNDTMGFIHIANAALFLQNASPALNHIVHFRNNQMVIAHGARSARDVTDALSEIDRFLIERGVIKPSKDVLRVAPEWVDEPWSELQATTPVCGEKLARFLGLPQVSSGLVTRCSQTNGFKLSRRAEGKAQGQYDLIAMGKNEAKLNGISNMLKEASEETGQLPILQEGHPDALKYLGTVQILATHDQCVFQRQIRVHTGGLEGAAEITDEVSGHFSILKRRLIAPPRGVVLQSHVAPVIGYVLAHEQQNHSYIELAEAAIKPHARGKIAQIHARFAPYPYMGSPTYDVS